MTNDQSLAEQLETDRPLIGPTLKSCSPTVAEALGYTPIDFLFVDRQHGSPVFERLEEIVRAADLNDVSVIVRVPTDDLSMITYFLDIGVDGIMLPQIEDPETVREASEHVRFDEGRSIATTSRAAAFGKADRSEYIDYVNEGLALLPQIETTAGVDVVDEVAALEETTALAIGPGDLSKSLGVPAGGPEVQETVDEIFERAAANDCGAGTFTSGASGIAQYEDRASFLVCNSDVGVLMSHFDDLLGGA